MAQNSRVFRRFFTRQQDYALLTGASALFIVLAIVLYVSRKMDWYVRDARQGARRLMQRKTQRYFLLPRFITDKN
jgi:hypothetical protein